MIQPRLHKQLFLDDGAIETRYGLRRALNKPDRVGPVMRPDRSLGQVSLQTHGPPQWNANLRAWELWYQSGYRDPDSGEPDTQESFTHYATSTDGLQWDRPALGLHEWNGSRDNNIVPNDDGLTLYHVLRDEREDDPQRRYKALFSDRGSGRLPAVSPDGLRWTMLDVPPIPADDTSRLTYDELGERFVATVKLSTKWGRSAWLSTSDDFNDWTEPELIFHSDEIDANNCRRRIKRIVEDPAYLSPPIVDRVGYPAEVYEMSVMPYEGLYVAFPVLFNPAGALPPPRNNHNGVNQVELAVSRDLRDWKRVANRDLFLGVMPWGRRGLRHVAAPHLRPARSPRRPRRDMGLLQRLSASAPGATSTTSRSRRTSRTSTASRWPRSGWTASSPWTPRKRGTMVTTPFVLDGGLFVNAIASGGELRAELVDAEEMRPLPGFSLAECDPVNGDHLDRELTWAGRSASPRQRPVRLRFEMGHSSLYAFWVG